MSQYNRHAPGFSGGPPRGGRGGRGGFRPGAAPRHQSAAGKLTFEQTDPPCLQQFQESESDFGWDLNFNSEAGQVNEFPPRKPEGVAEVMGQVKVLLNHFPVEINPPPIIYQYSLHIVRENAPKIDEAGVTAAAAPPTPAPAKPATNVKQSKYKKNKKPPVPSTNLQPSPSSSTAAGGASEAETPGNKKLLPALLRQEILAVLEPQLQDDFGPSFGIMCTSTQLHSVKPLEEKRPGLLEFKVDGKKVGRDGTEDNSTFLVIVHDPNVMETARLLNGVDLNDMRNVKITPDLVKLDAIYGILMSRLNPTEFQPRGQNLINLSPKVTLDLDRVVTTYPGYNVKLLIRNGWKKFVNMDLANMVAYKDGEVYEVLAGFFKMSVDECRDVTQWSEQEIQNASTLLRSCKIYYGPQKIAKNVNRLCPESVSEFLLSITDENYVTREMSVFDYFVQKKGIKLNDKNGPCLELQGGSRVPVEICKLKSGQSYNRKLDGQQIQEMGRITRPTPTELHANILKGIKDLNLTNNNLMRAYGVKLQDGGRMHQVNAKILIPPQLHFGPRAGAGDADPHAVLTPERGVWDIWSHDFQFFIPIKVDGWAVLNLAPRQVSQQHAMSFAQRLAQKGASKGMHLPSNQIYRESPGGLAENARQSLNWLAPTLTDLKNQLNGPLGQKGPKQLCFVLVILPAKNCEVYSYVKHAAELQVGLVTQCIAQENMQENFHKKVTQTKLESIAGNLLLKINGKLNGTNQLVLSSGQVNQLRDPFSIFNVPVMVMGADVTHPPPGVFTKKKGHDGKLVEIRPPSYAAVTASIDRTGMPYMMHAEGQKKAGAGAAEVVTGLEEMTLKFLREYVAKTGGYRPVKILYFRDGCGEGQFNEVLITEMSAIRRACTQFEEGYEPKITFVTVQKRHKTRFFVAGNREGEFFNAEPGTVVDTDIVDTCDNDFFLLSHQGIGQVALRPTRYHVLWDDSDFTLSQIQTMAYHLCYMFVRCSRSVKIPAPTYYAHLAAKRVEIWAKCWGEELWDDIEALNQRLSQKDNLMADYKMHWV